MDSHAENTRRIAKNTLMLYVRMLFSMLVSLYTSRVVLNTLGVEDYGIYNVVGGLVAMFSMVSSSLSSAVSRFLTFELGRGDMEWLKEMFSTALLIHIVLAGLVFILSDSDGIWFLKTQMSIPYERLYAANWVFQASVIAFMFGLFSVPYNASIISHERMSTFAYIGILEVVLRLLIVLFIAYVPLGYDKLIAYSLLLVVVSMSLQCIYLWYCRKHFEECLFKLHFNKTCWEEMSAFAGWNFIGTTSGLLKDQGVNTLLNIFIGPVVNAARGISLSVNSAVCSFAKNFMIALNPQITKSYASGDRNYMLLLSERGSRFSFYLILFFALPIFLETDFILKLWLGQYPEHTINFVRLVLVLSLCEVLSETLITMQLATGKIRNYQIAVGGMQLMNFPFSYLCLKLGLPPESVLVVALVVTICCLLLRLLFLRKMVGLSVCGYLYRVCGNVLAVTAVALPFPSVMVWQMSDGFPRFLIVCLLAAGSVATSIYWVGCTAHERNFIRDIAVGIMKRRLLNR